MNGVGPGPYYNTAMPDQYPPMQSQPQPVYSDTSPTPYSTDQPALIPEQTSIQDPQWFDITAPYQDPYQQQDPFADWPAPLQEQPTTPTMQSPQPMTTPSGAPYLSDEQLPTELKPWWDVPLEAPSMADVGFAPDVKTSSMTGFEDKFGGYEEKPVVYDTTYEVKKPAAGPIEFVGEVITNIADFAGDIVETIVDIGKFIIEHLQIDMAWKGGGFQATSGLLGLSYSTTPAKAGAEPQDYSEYYKIAQQGQLTSGAETQGPTMPGEFSTNMYLLAGGIILIVLLSRR